MTINITGHTILCMDIIKSKLSKACITITKYYTYYKYSC